MSSEVYTIGGKAALVQNGKVVADRTELCFTANTAGSTVELTVVGSPSISGSAYSTDGVTWTSFTPSTTAGTNTVTLANVGDKVYFRNNITASLYTSNYMKFVMSGSIAASGNVNSMYAATDFNSLQVLVYNYCYYNLFRDCTSLTAPPSFPATTLASYCYYYTFYNCTSLTTAPSLPATTLKTYCYYGMFFRCSSLTTAPSLPATTLALYCYNYMFFRCSSLYVSDTEIAGTATNAWIIPTNSIASGGTMGSMFAYCLGTRYTDSPNFNGVQNTYYTQNVPV